jgi:hypothetical protein
MKIALALKCFFHKHPLLWIKPYGYFKVSHTLKYQNRAVCALVANRMSKGNQGRDPPFVPCFEDISLAL